MPRTPDSELEARLRNQRPVAPASLVEAINAADPAGPRPARRLAPPRARRNGGAILFGVLLTAVLLAALAAVGGVSYAATAVSGAADAVRTVVVTHTHATPVSVNAVDAVDSAGDQYRPGYGFGDPNHNHTGPPGLTKGTPGEKTPPAQTKRIGKAILVSTSITVDEQAALYFSVLDPDGNKLLLTQKGSRFGSDGAQGVQAKTIHVVMLVPRTLPFALRIPANLLQPGKTYRVRIIAVDAQGNKSTTFIPFTA